MQQFGEDLRCARDLSMRFKRLKQNDDLNRAWDYYYSMLAGLSPTESSSEHYFQFPPLEHRIEESQTH